MSGATHCRLAKLDQGEDPDNEAQWDNYGGDLTVTSMDVTGLTAGTAYKFRVKACNASGCSVVRPDPLRCGRLASLGHVPLTCFDPRRRPEAGVADNPRIPADCPKILPG